MISSISLWANNIVITVIIATIIEMILPDSNNKKYVKTVIGVFILFTIVAPVITKISNNEISLENILANAKIDDIHAEQIDYNTNNDIKKVYIDNLKNDLKKTVEEKGYIAKEININIESNEENDYGKIKLISFRIVPKDGNIEIVNTISIDTSKPKEESQKYSEMQEYIAYVYQIDKEIVNVY